MSASAVCRRGSKCHDLISWMVMSGGGVFVDFWNMLGSLSFLLAAVLVFAFVAHATLPISPALLLVDSAYVGIPRIQADSVIVLGGKVMPPTPSVAASLVVFFVSVLRNLLSKFWMLIPSFAFGLRFSEAVCASSVSSN